AASLTGTELTMLVQASSNVQATLNTLTSFVFASPVPVTKGGTGLATLTSHAVLLGEATGNVSFATVGTAGRILTDQGASADPSFQAMSGDATINSGGVITVAKLNGVAYPTSPSNNTVPVVTSSNQVTY